MVVFKDMSNGTTFLSKSTAVTSETVIFEEDGQEYPVIKLEISNTSHPFYTGKNVSNIRNRSAAGTALSLSKR